MSLKAVLFDVDGTLADTEVLGHLPAYNSAFRDAGLNWDWDEALYRDELLLLPGGRERLRYFVDTHAPVMGDEQIGFDNAPDEWVNAIHARKSDHFRQRLESGMVPLRTGVSRLIRECQEAGIQMAIVSNASQRTLEPFLEFSLGALREQMQFVISGEQVEQKKPHPDLYLRAAAQLGVSPAECVAIEDSALGMSASVAAGIATVVTVNANTRDQDFSGASLVVSSLGDAREPNEILRGGQGSAAVTVATLRALLDDRQAP